MRWLIGIFAILVTLWCGWWFTGRHLVLTQAEKLISEQQAAGGELSLPGLSLAGFPSRFDLSADSVTWRDASGRFSYEGGAIHSYAMSWKPWHLIFWLPDSQAITVDGERLQIDGQKLHASLRAAPSMDLPFALATFSGEDITLSAANGTELGLTVDVLRLEAQAAEGTTHPYRLGAKLSEIRPDPSLTLALAAVNVPQMPATPLPDLIEGIHLDATLTLTQPLDRHAGQTKPQLLAVDLRDLSMAWGDLRLVASGMLSPDDQGYAAGTIAVTVSGWEQLPRLLVAIGSVEPQMAGFASNILRGMASEGGDPAKITVNLVLKDGWMSFGPLPLGEAPKLGAPKLGAAPAISG